MHFQCTARKRRLAVPCVKMMTLNDVWWDWRTLRFDYIINFEVIFVNQYAFTQFLFNCLTLRPGHEKDFPLSRSPATQWQMHTQPRYLLSPLPACELCARKRPRKNKLKHWIGDYRKTHSAVTDKENYFDFWWSKYDAHTKNAAARPLCSLIFMIFRLHIHITIACCLTQIHKKCTQIYCYRLYRCRSHNNDIKNRTFST